MIFNLIILHSAVHIYDFNIFVTSKFNSPVRGRQVSRIPVIYEIFKKIFFYNLGRNISLTLFYTPSKSNPANVPSRVLSDIVCSLSDAVAWRLVDGTFDPHSKDLIALPSNAWRDTSGRPLRLFSPQPYSSCPDATCSLRRFARRKTPTPFRLMPS